MAVDLGDRADGFVAVVHAQVSGDRAAEFQIWLRSARGDAGGADCGRLGSRHPALPGAAARSLVGRGSGRWRAGSPAAMLTSGLGGGVGCGVSSAFGGCAPVGGPGWLLRVGEIGFSMVGACMWWF